MHGWTFGIQRVFGSCILISEAIEVVEGGRGRVVEGSALDFS
jgi:hypothetical protein